MSYRTKPQVVEAFRWLGQPEEEFPSWVTPGLIAQSGIALYAYTKTGPLRVNRGDWVVLSGKDIAPVTDEEFNEKYEPVATLNKVEVTHGA